MTVIASLVRLAPVRCYHTWAAATACSCICCWAWKACCCCWTANCYKERQHNHLTQSTCPLVSNVLLPAKCIQLVHDMAINRGVLSTHFPLHFFQDDNWNSLSNIYDLENPLSISDLRPHKQCGLKSWAAWQIPCTYYVCVKVSCKQQELHMQSSLLRSEKYRPFWQSVYLFISRW